MVAFCHLCTNCIKWINNGKVMPVHDYQHKEQSSIQIWNFGGRKHSTKKLVGKYDFKSVKINHTSDYVQTMLINFLTKWFMIWTINHSMVYNFYLEPFPHNVYLKNASKTLPYPYLVGNRQVHNLCSAIHVCTSTAQVS